MLLGLALLVAPQSLLAQGLREVPQRFVFVQPLGLILGVGYAGVEFNIGRTTTFEIGAVGVYSQEDGIKIYGGGPGVGIRKYFGEAEAAGIVIGGRVDGVWLQADNSDAQRQFLTTPLLQQRRDHLYLGMGVLFGYRWVSIGGWFAEPAISYEYFAGPRPLVPGSGDLQDNLGISVGVAFGLAW
jgi:hypothetical protein